MLWMIICWFDSILTAIEYIVELIFHIVQEEPFKKIPSVSWQLWSRACSLTKNESNAKYNIMNENIFKSLIMQL